MRACGILFQLDAGVFKYLGVFQVLFEFAQLHLWRGRLLGIYRTTDSSAFRRRYVPLPTFTSAYDEVGGRIVDGIIKQFSGEEVALLYTGKWQLTLLRLIATFTGGLITGFEREGDESTAEFYPFPVRRSVTRMQRRNSCCNATRKTPRHTYCTSDSIDDVFKGAFLLGLPFLGLL